MPLTAWARKTALELIVFVPGSRPLAETGYRIVGAHTDSPGLRLKPRAALAGDGLMRLGVEEYGGPILATFTDRDLSLAGRVVMRTAAGPQTRLRRFDQPLVRLPNLAIHMNREVNEQGLKLNKQTELPLILGPPGVGENLQDHLPLRLMYKVSKPITTNDDLRSLWRQFGMGVKWLLQRRGPLAIGINQGGLFTRVLPESESPDIQFHFGTVSAEMAGAKPHPWSGCTFSVCQLRPQSRGTVFIKSRDPLAAPGMLANYLSHETDRRCAIASIKYARHLAAAPALREYLIEEYRPGPAVASDAEVLDWARDYGATIFHPSGTCKMGSDPLAVVDARLRVHGLAGLRVVDCSIMPTLVSGNTNAPVVMIAEKASDLILEDQAGR